MVPTPEPARSDEFAAALRLLFGHLESTEAEKRLSNALLLLERGELNRDGIFVLRGVGGGDGGAANSIYGVFVCLPLVGATGLVWPPRCVTNADTLHNEDLLVRHGTGWLRHQGVKVAQALLALEESELGAPLLRNGFQHITHLNFFRHDLDLPLRLLQRLEKLEYQSYEECDPALFRQTLARTYLETRDCPELNGVREVAEVILGHQSQGRFDPTRWFLACAGGEPIGVLMLTEMPESGDWDLSYTGITPEYRRQGFGTELVLKALLEAKAADAMYLSLAVDGRNVPALALYRQLGFEPYDRREVYLAICRDDAPPVANSKSSSIT